MTVLYRFRDADGALLYVGITDQGPRRWRQHMRDKTWWPDVDHIDLEHHPDRHSASTAERHAIATEHPRHNIAGTARPGRPATPRPYGDLGWQWRCDWCDKPTHTSDGKMWHYRSDPSRIFVSCGAPHEHLETQRAYSDTSVVRDRALFVEYVGACTWTSDAWFTGRVDPCGLIKSLQDFATHDLSALWSDALRIADAIDQLRPNEPVSDATAYGMLSRAGVKHPDAYSNAANHIRSMRLRANSKAFA